MARLPALVALAALAAAATVAVGWESLDHASTAAHVGGANAAASMQVAPPISIEVGGVPTDVEASPTGVWVATGLGGIVRVNPETNRVVAHIRPGGAVTSLARGLGAVWALDLFGERLLRIDPRSNRVTSVTRVDSLPSAVAVGHGLVWVASQLESSVAGIDPRTGRVVKLALFARDELWPGGLAVDRNGVWVVTGHGNEVSVFDPETMRFRERLSMPGARTLVADGSGAWVGVAGGSTLLRIRHGRVTQAPLGMHNDGYGPSLATAGRVWVAARNAVVELDPAHGTVLGRTRLPRGTNAGPIAVDGDVWVVDAERRALVRVGAYTRREVSR